ncbi:MAG: hypothetical protein AAFO69_18040, partial [Bacteroidota bacterium]
MKSLLTALALIALLISCNSTENEIPEKKLVEGGEGYPQGAIRQVYEDIPGLEKVTVDGSKFLQSEGDYLNGERHGAWVEYHSNGLVKTLTTYFQGKKQGMSLEISD